MQRARWYTLSEDQSSVGKVSGDLRDIGEKGAFVKGTVGTRNCLLLLLSIKKNWQIDRFYQNSVIFGTERNLLKKPVGMASLLVKILCVVCMYGFGPLNSNFVHGATDSSLAWDIRIRETLNKLQTRPCWGRSRGSQCDDSMIVGMDTRKMRLFIAQGQKKSSLRVVLPDRRQRRLTSRSHRNDSYDAVFVLDPYPDTNFGHVVFIFLVDFDVNQTVCRNMNGVPVNTGESEGVYAWLGACITIG